MVQVLATAAIGILILILVGAGIDRERFNESAGDYYTACAVLILSIILIWR
jgi:hypothetical protein